MPISDPADYDTFVKLFARTYRYEDDPWDRVEAYQRVLKYTAKHPSKGSAAVASALDLPRPMLRRWVDQEAVPYVVQGIQTAEENGWLPMDFQSETFQGMNVLVSWVFSSGSIHKDRFSAQFVVDDNSDRHRLRSAFDRIGVDEVEPDKPGTGLRGTTLSATPHGSILGRILHVLGAPLGSEKHSDDIRLPPYLDYAPTKIRRGFARTYALNRKREYDGQSISWGEDRPEAYHQQLIELFRDVTGEHVKHSGIDVYLSAAAARSLSIEPLP